MNGYGNPLKALKFADWFGMFDVPGGCAPTRSARGMLGADARLLNFCTTALTSPKLGCDPPPNARITSPHFPMATRSGTEQLLPLASHIHTL